MKKKGIVLYVMLGRRISFKRIAALIQYSTQKHTMGYIGKRPNIVLVNKGIQELPQKVYNNRGEMILTWNASNATVRHLLRSGGTSSVLAY